MDKNFIIQCLSESRKIYYNPLVGTWEIAEEFLSGDIRQKIKAARSALENKEICADPLIKKSLEQGLVDLEKALPLPVLPERVDLHEDCLRALNFNTENLTEEEQNFLVQNTISVSLGTTWIDEDLYTEFAQWLLKSNCKVKYVAGQYEIFNQHYSHASHEYTVGNYSGYDILAATLNLKSIKVYDEVREGNQARKILNPEKTRHIQMKTSEIKQKFQEWLWSDKNRAISLIVKYNEIFNSNRAREYNGAHLRFPGLNPNAKPTPEQCNDIWRIIKSQYAGIFAEVGFGKTWVLTIAAMELKRLKLAKRIIIAVLSDNLEQWAKEVKFLYPNARILYHVESKNEPKKDRRAILYGQIKNADWDIILLTHEQLLDMPISESSKAYIITKSIQEYKQAYKNLEKNAFKDRSIYSEVRRKITKLSNTINKLEEKIQAIYEKDRQFAYTLWEDLEVDCLMIDEAHKFKNLGFQTNLENIAGICNRTSQRALNLYCKILEMRSRNGKVVFATGTPISNSIGELYILKKYLAEHELVKRNISTFDSWVQQFAEITYKAEVNPLGEYKIKERFSRFKNLPELIEMVREFASIRTHKSSNFHERPIPFYYTEQIPPTKAQTDYLKALVARADSIINKTVDPTQDNMAKISAEARMMSLDMGVLGIKDDTPNSKLNIIIRNIYIAWQILKPIKGVQIIFCDLVRHAYAYIVAHLCKLGIPRHEIAIIRDFKNREQIYEKARQGSIRILLASTDIAGTGVNIQTRLAVLHHADAPWRPSDVIQREGRIVRFKNMLKEVVILRYVNSSQKDRMSFDTFAWQVLENKAKFYEQIWNNANKQRIPRCIADIYSDKSLSYAEVKALASGNSYLLEQAELTNRLKNLELEKAIFAKKLLTLKKDKQRADEFIERFQKWLIELQSNTMQLGNIQGVQIDSWETLYKVLKSKKYIFELDAIGYIKQMPISTKVTNDTESNKLVVKYCIDDKIIPLNSVENMKNMIMDIINRKIELCQQKIDYYQQVKDATIEDKFPGEREIIEITQKLAEIEAYIQIEAIKEANTQLKLSSAEDPEEESEEEPESATEVPEDELALKNSTINLKAISYIKQSSSDILNDNSIEWIQTLKRAVEKALPILGEPKPDIAETKEMGEIEIKICENGQLAFF